MSVNVKFNKNIESAVLPVKDGDGYILYSIGHYMVKPLSKISVNTGISIFMGNNIIGLVKNIFPLKVGMFLVNNILDQDVCEMTLDFINLNVNLKEINNQNLFNQIFGSDPGFIIKPGDKIAKIFFVDTSIQKK
jgi:dUTPase